MLLDVGDHGGAGLGVHGHQVLDVVMITQVQAVHQVRDLSPVQVKSDNRNLILAQCSLIKIIDNQ